MRKVRTRPRTRRSQTRPEFPESGQRPRGIRPIRRVLGVTRSGDIPAGMGLLPMRSPIPPTRSTSLRMRAISLCIRTTSLRMRPTPVRVRRGLQSAGRHRSVPFRGSLRFGPWAVREGGRPGPVQKCSRMTPTKAMRGAPARLPVRSTPLPVRRRVLRMRRTSLRMPPRSVRIGRTTVQTCPHGVAVRSGVGKGCHWVR